MIICYDRNCERNGIDDICCKCCDMRFECDFACYHVLIEDDLCLSEVRIKDDKDEWTTKASIK